jgi:hypothetical protein
MFSHVIALSATLKDALSLPAREHVSTYLQLERQELDSLTRPNLSTYSIILLTTCNFSDNSSIW